MTFYEDITHKIYSHRMIIKDTYFSVIEYIEHRHKDAPFPGIDFYTHLRVASHKHWGKDLKKELAREIKEYCDLKINELKEKNNIHKPQPKR